jgi:hypothetical protein
MSRGRPSLSPRVPIFVGCEGESERSYVRLLTTLIMQQQLLVHLDAVVLGGGDPCAIVERAVQRLDERKRKRGSQYHANFVLLDADRLGQSADRDARLVVLANNAGLQLVWQSPCHEGLLLRHIENCVTLRPPTSALAEAQLCQRWPEYEKALTATQIANRIDLAAVRRAATVEPDLKRFLQSIGLVDHE